MTGASLLSCSTVATGTWVAVGGKLVAKETRESARELARKKENNFLNGRDINFDHATMVVAAASARRLAPDVSSKLRMAKSSLARAISLAEIFKT